MLSLQHCPLCGAWADGSAAFPSTHERARIFGILLSCSQCDFSWSSKSKKATKALYFGGRSKPPIYENCLSIPEAQAISAERQNEFFLRRSAHHRDLLERNTLGPLQSCLNFGAGNCALFWDWDIEGPVAVDTSALTEQICSELNYEYQRELSGLHGRTFDCIVASHVLEHLHAGNLLSVFSNLVSLLRPGGVLLIEVPDFGQQSESDVRLDHYPHTLFFSTKSLRKLAQTRTDVSLAEMSEGVSGRVRINGEFRPANAVLVVRKDN